MGWVSSGSEGGSLNKRISVFNFSWAAGSIVGCYVGGTLFRVVQWLPFFTAAGATVLAIVCILGVQGRQQVPESVKESAEDDLEPMQLVLFRWIWRVGFISAWVALGALKFPIATLIKEMGRGSEYHAIISSGMNMVFMCCFFLLGRTMVWHLNLSIF
jgi:hypothetical protein